MVRIRLRRVGARSQPSFRIVATDRRSPRDGRFLEILGHYNPRTEPATVSVDEARLFHWLTNGAQPTNSVRSALNRLGTWDRWSRFKAGEDLESLMAEAKAAVVEVDPRTRRDDFSRARPSKKTRAKESAPEAAEPEPAAAEATPMEAEPEPEAAPATEAEAKTISAVEAETEAPPEAETPVETQAAAEETGEAVAEVEAEDRAQVSGQADEAVAEVEAEEKAQESSEAEEPTEEA